MRKRVHITLAVVLVMLAGVIAWQALRLREPVYQGKPLSFWLELSTSHGFTKNPDDREVQAIQQIGTNALPVLLAILRAHDTRFKQVLMTWAQKQNGELSRRWRFLRRTHGRGCRNSSVIELKPNGRWVTVNCAGHYRDAKQSQAAGSPVRPRTVEAGGSQADPDSTPVASATLPPARWPKAV